MNNHREENAQGKLRQNSVKEIAGLMAKTSDDTEQSKGGEMQFDLDINNLVVVKAPNVWLGQRGRVVNRFARIWTLYAVQFNDNCVGYFERSEFKRCSS